MKYLYPYECEKRRLSTPAELQAAIDGNRREGRRSSYGTYAASGSTTNESLVQRNPHTPNSLALHAQMSPLSLVTAVAAGGQHHGSQSLVNGSAAHTPLPHHPHHPQHSQGLPGQPPNAGQCSNCARAPIFFPPPSNLRKSRKERARECSLSPSSSLRFRDETKPAGNGGNGAWRERDRREKR